MRSLNKKMNFRIFDNPRREIFRMGKNPCGDSEKFPLDSEKSPRENIFPMGFANSRRDFDLCG